MKNSIKKTCDANQKMNFFKKVFFTLLIGLFVQVSTINASNGIIFLKPTKCNNVNTTDPVYNQLFNAIKTGGKCYNAKITSVSVKNNKYAFTSFSKGFLRIQSGYNIAISGLQTEFDDRRNFQGAKTIENIVIYKRGHDNIGVSINMKTWGNKTIQLQNAKINREPYGYFVTGKVTDGNRTVYYTIGIYETACLI